MAHENNKHLKNNEMYIGQRYKYTVTMDSRKRGLMLQVVGNTAA